MTEDQQVAPSEATDEPVIETQEGQGEAQTAEGEEGQKPETPEDEAKKSAAKERREREKAYKARLREEKEAAEKRAAAAEANLAKIKGATQAEPKEAEFADYTEYAAAKAVWRYAQGLNEREAGNISAEVEHARKVAEEMAARERALAYEGFDAARQDARSRYADYDAVVGQPGLFPKGSHLPDLIVASDHSADVAYEIAKDRNLHDQLLYASPVEAARIIGRLEAKVSVAPPRSKTSAPDPISPVRGPAASGKSPDAMSQEEFNRWRENGGTF